MEARLNICVSVRVGVHPSLRLSPAPLISSPQRGAPGPHPQGPVRLIECDGADIISILSPWLGIRNSCSLASANRIKSVLGRARASAKRRVSVSSASNGEQTGDRPVHYTHNRLAAHTHTCTHRVIFFIIRPCRLLSFTGANEKMSPLMAMLSLCCHLFALAR